MGEDVIEIYVSNKNEIAFSEKATGFVFREDKWLNKILIEYDVTDEPFELDLLPFFNKLTLDGQDVELFPNKIYKGPLDTKSLFCPVIGPHAIKSDGPRELGDHFLITKNQFGEHTEFLVKRHFKDYILFDDKGYLVTLKAYDSFYNFIRITFDQLIAHVSNENVTVTIQFVYVEELEEEEPEPEEAEGGKDSSS